MLSPCAILVRSSKMYIILRLGQGAWLSNQHLGWTSGPIHPTQPGPLVPWIPCTTACCGPKCYSQSSSLFCLTLSLYKLVAFLVPRPMCPTWSLDTFSSASWTSLPGCPVTCLGTNWIHYLLTHIRPNMSIFLYSLSWLMTPPSSPSFNGKLPEYLFYFLYTIIEIICIYLFICLPH